MKRAIYYDTETTGVRSDKDRIIEIAAFDPLENRTFVQLINPGMPIPQEATAIHHISDEMVANSPSFAEVGKAFTDFCGSNCVLIAHNNDAFDRQFIEQEFKRAALELPHWHYVDSLRWARKYRPDLPRHTLQFLREVYNIPANQAHRALDDVKVLHAVFSLMTDDLSIETVMKLLEKRVEVDKMPFGKHQGKPLSEVPRDYVRWLKENGALDKPENKELLLAFEKIK